MLLQLAGVSVTAVAFHTGGVVVNVRLRRRRLLWLVDAVAVRQRPSTWRALHPLCGGSRSARDCGRLAFRRVVVEAVEFALDGARHP